MVSPNFTFLYFKYLYIVGFEIFNCFAIWSEVNSFCLYKASANQAFCLAFADNPFGLPPNLPIAFADFIPAIVL